MISASFSKHLRGSVLLTSLFILMLAFLFFYDAKDRFLSQGRHINHNYEYYLKLRLELSRILDKIDCPFDKSQFSENINKIDYNYHCNKDGLFLREKILYKTYVQVDIIENYFDISKIRIAIDDLHKLPESSLANPKVVLLNKPFSGSLTRDFYGIIITNHPINLSSGNNIIGTIYSPLNKDSQKLRYVKKPDEEMINQIVLDYTQYFYMPHSKNLLNVEK